MVVLIRMCIFYVYWSEKWKFPSHLETFLTEYVTENDCRLEEFSFLYFLVIFSLVSFSLFFNIPKFQVEYPSSIITRGHT